MNPLYQQLVERARGEIPELEHTFQRVVRVWDRMQEVESEEREIYLESVALNLHGFYSGLEHLFELIARHVDQVMPTGETWHRDLLWKLAAEVPDVRPAVIGQQSARMLDELRRFRHLVRHVYAVNLEPEKVNGLIEELSGTWSTLRAELLAFVEFLEEAGRDDD